MQIMAGAKKITITLKQSPAGSTKSCLQPIFQYVSVLSCAATSPQFPDSSADSQLEPAPLLLLGDRWHEGAAAFRGKVKQNEESRSGQRARDSPLLSSGSVSSPCCRGSSNKCQESHKYINLTNLPCGVGSGLAFCIQTPSSVAIIPTWLCPSRNIFWHLFSVEKCCHQSLHLACLQLPALEAQQALIYQCVTWPGAVQVFT